MISFRSLKLAFLGSGSMAQNLIKGYLSQSNIKPENIFISGKNPEKTFKKAEKLKVQALLNNEDLLEKADIIFLCVKPQEAQQVIEELSFQWDNRHSVLSIIAGLSFKELKKAGLRSKRLARLMPNTNVSVGKGLLAFCSLENQENFNTFVEKLLEPLGESFKVEEEALLDSLTVACASGSSFVLEIMEYWQEWLVGEGFTKEQAKNLTLNTFFGTCFMSEKRSDKSFFDLQKEIASNNGVSEAGLKNIRELELERILRLSFEQAKIRLKEISFALSRSPLKRKNKIK